MKVPEKPSLRNEAHARNAACADFLSDRSCPAVRTEYEVLQLMRQCTAQFGFSHFMIARMPADDRQRFAERLVLSNWPSDMVRDYDALMEFHGCALIGRLRQTKLPVSGDTADFFKETTGTALPAAPFPALPPGRTFAVLLHSTQGEAFAVLLSGAREEPSREEAANLYLTLVRLFEALEKTFGPVASREKLSAREVECLRWAAAGKSSEEIAIILGISVYTVSSYFKTATRKLDAVNRMQAIARAMRLKLI